MPPLTGLDLLFVVGYYKDTAPTALHLPGEGGRKPSIARRCPGPVRGEIFVELNQRKTIFKLRQERHLQRMAADHRYIFKPLDE